MSTPDLLCDQRSSFRCLVAESRRQCALRIGEETLPAWLLDESAGGFSVLVDRPLNLETEQTILLQTDSGWFNVRVTSTVETPPPEDCEVVDSEKPTEWFRLGLQRLGDAVPLDEPSVSPFAEDLRFRLRQLSPANGWMSAAGVLLALAAISVPLGLASMLLNVRRSEDGNTVSMNDPWASFSERKSSDGRLPAEGFGGGGFQTITPGFDKNDSTFSDIARSLLDFSGNRTDEPNAFGAKSEGDLCNLVRRLPGSTALALPEVVRRLRLTEKQQELIQQLIDAMAEAIRKLDLDPRLRGVERRRIKQLRDKLLDDYLRRALDLLTPEQQAEWEKLHDEPTAKQSPASSLLKKGATAGLSSSAWRKLPEKHCWTSQQWHPNS